MVGRVLSHLKPSGLYILSFSTAKNAELLGLYPIKESQYETPLHKGPTIVVWAGLTRRLLRIVWGDTVTFGL